MRSEGVPAATGHIICDGVFVPIHLGIGGAFHCWYKRSNPTGLNAKCSCPEEKALVHSDTESLVHTLRSGKGA